MSYVVNGEELETGEEDFLLEANFSDDVCWRPTSATTYPRSSPRPKKSR